MSNDLVQFLRDRLDDIESAALGAKGNTLGRWTQDDGPPEDIVLYDKSGKLTVGQARHIARHDPARVLREVEAKRVLLDDYERFVAERRRMMGGWGSYPEISPVLTAFAAVYADHPDYREEWKS